MRKKLADRSDIASHAAALKARSRATSPASPSSSRSRSSSPSIVAASPPAAKRKSTPKQTAAAAARRAATPASKTRGAASKKVKMDDENDGEQQQTEQASPAVKSESDDGAAPPAAAASSSAASVAAATALAAPSPPSAWACARCTMENDLAAKVCSMCDAKRPASAPSATAAKARLKKGRKDADSSDDDDGEAQPSSSEEDTKAKAKRKRKPAASAAAASRSTKGGRKRGAPVPNERSLRECFPSMPSSSHLSPPPLSQRYTDDSAPPQRERSKLTLSVLDRTRSTDTASPSKPPLIAPVCASGRKGPRVYHDLTLSQSQSQTQSQSQSQGGDDESEVSIVERSKVEQAAVDRAKRRKLAASNSAAASGKLALTLSMITSTPPSARPARSASSLADSNLPTTVPSVLWIDKYAPHAEEDLCMHKAKLAEIKAWLQTFGRPAPPPRSPLSLITAAREGRDARYGHGQSLLILAGPAGSAKSATIRVLAANLGYDVVTWFVAQPTCMLVLWFVRVTSFVAHLLILLLCVWLSSIGIPKRTPSATAAASGSPGSVLVDTSAS